MSEQKPKEEKVIPEDVKDYIDTFGTSLVEYKPGYWEYYDRPYGYGGWPGHFYDQNWGD